MFYVQTTGALTVHERYKAVNENQIYSNCLTHDILEKCQNNKICGYCEKTGLHYYLHINYQNTSPFIPQTPQYEGNEKQSGSKIHQTMSRASLSTSAKKITSNMSTINNQNNLLYLKNTLYIGIYNMCYAIKDQKLPFARKR